MGKIKKKVRGFMLKKLLLNKEGKLSKSKLGTLVISIGGILLGGDIIPVDGYEIYIKLAIMVGFMLTGVGFRDAMDKSGVSKKR
jgi:hypothetical protein